MEEVPGYRIGRRIGRGGFAVVHEAEQLSLGRAVALKMLMPELADEHDLRRFARERMLLSELSRHRHVVDVIDAGTTTGGRPFIVMRLYRRGSLAQALADGGPLSPATVVDVVTKVAGALQAAHNLGVIHRDVKPENVLIADDGEPALADFGISVLVGPEGTTGNLFTMAHAAPEVLERGEYGVASDVYALASTAYTLLAGRVPFTRANQFALMRAIVETPVPPLGLPEVPPALEAAVVRGMAKRPGDRYPNVIALADALRAALGTWATTLGTAVPLPSVPATVGSGPAVGAGRAGEHRTAFAVAPPTAVPPTALPAGPAPPGTAPRSTAPPAARPPAARRGGAARAPGRREAAPAGGRRRIWTVGVATAAAVAGLLGSTYALGLPPGSLLTPRGPGGATVFLAADFSGQDLPPGGNVTDLAIQLYLDRVHHTAGGHRVEMRPYDIASPQHTRWDSAACEAAARRHVGARDEIAVIGPYNSGCAKIAVPILGQDAATAIIAVSNGSTDPGLTRPWDVGEPDKYYPAKVRTFARVVTTDDVQGRAAADFAATDLGVSTVFILDDGGVYGRNVARSFAEAVKDKGVQVVGTARWDRGAENYTDLFARVKRSGAGAVFLAGAVSSNGLRLVQDKVAVLGDNQHVRLLAADGFTGEPRLAELPEAQGMYVTFPGLSPESVRRRGGAGSEFLDAYQAANGADPRDPYALYAVAAVQVVLQAVAQSDGTRAGVRRAIFSAPGVTVPQARSVLGRDISIDPATGDVSIKDVTVEVIKRYEETFETVESIT
ncbi:MAG TPA: protein kinase [Kineosporiaceae bacterium]